MIIAVGSTNPVKIAATEEAIKLVHKRAGIYGELQVLGTPVASGVPDQPFSEQETQQGAANRAKAALVATSSAHLGAGLEGGVSEEAEGLYSTVWVAITDREGHTLTVNGNRFLLPDEVTQGIRNGQEMGIVMDALTGETNVKQKGGMIGVLTGGVIARQEAYEHLMKMAYALWRVRYTDGE